METLILFASALQTEAAREGYCLSICSGVPMAQLCSFRIGGEAALTVAPTTAEELCFCVSFAYAAGVPYRLFGNGSNLLPPDTCFHGLIIRTSCLKRISELDGYIEAECGVPLNSLILFCADRGFCGTERLFGIPGTVGGALCMNAGAHGAEIADHFCDADIYDVKSGRIFCFEKNAMRFAYRQSVLQNCPHLVLLRARFSFASAEPTAIRSVIREISRKRAASQPLAYPSAGSVFRRPAEGEAWRFIDACHLRGFQIGGAQISEKHAGFIINRGGARAADVLALAALCERRVEERFGVRLIREIEAFDSFGRKIG